MNDVGAQIRTKKNNIYIRIYKQRLIELAMCLAYQDEVAGSCFERGVSASAPVHHNLVGEQQVRDRHRCLCSPGNHQWVCSDHRQAEPGKNPVSLTTL